MSLQESQRGTQGNKTGANAWHVFIPVFSVLPHMRYTCVTSPEKWDIGELETVKLQAKRPLEKGRTSLFDTQTWSKSTLFKPCKGEDGPGPKYYQTFLAQGSIFISRFVRFHSLKERPVPILLWLDGSQCQYETNGKIFAIHTSTTRPDMYYPVLR